MTINPHKFRRSVCSQLFSIRIIQRVSLLSMLLLAFSIAALPQTTTTSTSEGIQKRWNEFGVWGGISFDATTLIGKTPDARFGNIGLRYGRVLAARKTVAFEWTIDAIPVAVLSNNRFTVVPSGTGFVVTQTRKIVYAWGAAPIGLKFNFRRN